MDVQIFNVSEISLRQCVLSLDRKRRKGNVQLLLKIAIFVHLLNVLIFFFQANITVKGKHS